MKQKQSLKQEESVDISPVQPKIHQQKNNRSNSLHNRSDYSVESSKEKSIEEKNLAWKTSKRLVSNSITDAMSSTEINRKADCKINTINLVVYDEKVPIKFNIKSHQTLSKFLVFYFFNNIYVTNVSLI